MQERRSFLLSAGTLTVANTVGTVSGSGRNGGFSSETINKRVLSGVDDNGAEGARQVLEGLGLNPTVKTKRLKSATRGDSGDEQQITPEYVYGKPENNGTSIIVAASPATSSDDEVWMTVSMKLEDPKHKMRNSWWCPDAIGIGFTKSDWAPMGTPTVNATDDHTAKYTAEDVADDALAGTVNIKNHTGGIAIGEALPDASVTLTGKFRLRDRGEPSTLWGSYTHTYSYIPGGEIDSISGGYGGLSIDLNTRASTVWSIANSADPEDDI